MIERLHPPAPHVVALRVGGRITTEDVERAEAALDEALAAHERVSLFVVLDGVGWVDPAALLRDLRYSLGQLKNLHRFGRVAVVTGLGWVQALVGAEDAALPGVDVRSFVPSARADAEAWVSAAPPPPEPALVPLPSPRPNALAYAVRGTLREDDLAPFEAALRAAVAEHGAADVFLRVERAPGVGLDAIGPALGRMKLHALGHVRRYAVVGGPGWLAAAAGLLEPLLPVRVRHFEAGEDTAAWAWLDAGRDEAGSGPLANGGADDPVA